MTVQQAAICAALKGKNAAACTTRLLDKISLEDRISEIIFALADEKNLVTGAQKAIAEAAIMEENAGEFDQIKNELDKVRALMRELFSDYYDYRLISREQFTQKNSEYLEKEKVLMDKLEQMDAQSPTRNLENAKLMIATAAAMRDDWDKMTEAEKKLALWQVVRQIDVYPRKVVVDLFVTKKR